MVKINCSGCGVEFEKQAWRKEKFCSISCFNATKAKPLGMRFWDKVDRNGPIPVHVPELGPCWVWLRAISSKGYGKIGHGGRDRGHMPAHRAAWEITYGDIPTDLWVLHRCDNRVCVNPKHLFLGTHIDNMADMDAKGRRDAGRGTRKPNAKLDPEKVRGIRSRLSRGETWKDIAAHYSVSEGAIQAVAQGKTWKHVA